MRDRFQCGHLVLYKNGTVKPVKFEKGSGSRNCKITHYDMSFGEIHDRLRELFLKDDFNRDSRLYDYECKEFDLNRYANFYDYVDKNGLQFRRKLLYLCTLADDRISFDSTEKQTSTVILQSTSNSVPVIKSTNQVEVKSSTLFNEIKHEDTLSLLSKQSSINNHYYQLKNLQIFSYSNYSFKQSLNELFDYVQDLFQQYRHEKILFELFEHISALRFISLPFLDLIKQQNYSINQQKKSDYDNDLEKIKNLSQFIKELIKSNKKTISNIDQHSIIINSFNQFYQHFNTLCDRWMNERNISTTSSSSSSSSSSSRHHSDEYSRKRTQTSSRSPHRSSFSYQTTAENNGTDDGYSLFKHLLKSLDYLLKVLCELHFIAFSKVVRISINKIESYRSNIILSDYQSLSIGKNILISIQNHLSDQMKDEHRYATTYKIPDAYEIVSNSIKVVLNSIENYQSKINNHKRLRPTSTEEKSIQPKIRIDDDQSSETSHSTIADEDLKKEAKNAYERKSKH